MSNLTLEQQLRKKYNQMRAYMQFINYVLIGSKFKVRLVKHKKEDIKKYIKDGYAYSILGQSI